MVHIHQGSAESSATSSLLWEPGVLDRVATVSDLVGCYGERERIYGMRTVDNLTLTVKCSRLRETHNISTHIINESAGFQTGLILPTSRDILAVIAGEGGRDAT